MEITETKTDQIPYKLLGVLAGKLQASLALTARSCELAELSGEAADISGARVTSESALSLVNDYVLGLKLMNLENYSLELEPVALGAVLTETASQLEELADNYGVKLDVEIYGRNLPVLGHQRALAAALSAAGRCLIETLPDSGSDNQLTLKLVSRRSRFGLTAGWYWRAEKHSSEMQARAKKLLAASRQPLTEFCASSASGVLIADMLLAPMDSKLVVNKFRNWSGLEATLEPSRQTVLV